MLTEKCAPTEKLSWLKGLLGVHAVLFFSSGGGSKTLMGKCDRMGSIIHMHTRIDL